VDQTSQAIQAWASAVTAYQGHAAPEFRRTNQRQKVSILGLWPLYRSSLFRSVKHLCTPPGELRCAYVSSLVTDPFHSYDLYDYNI
jgi:hypothetical protein